MKKKINSAFTLVELIVVITILAILGTIAFISLQGYSSQSRDSVRISDMSRMKTGLELFQLDAGKYPIPTDGTEVTYSGGTVWTQGYFGDSTYKNVGKLDKIPLDPLTDKKYVYSRTNTRQEFQIAGVMEGEEVTFNSNQVNAGTKTALIKVSGNYNGKVLKVSTGSVDYILAMPSILTSSGETDVVNIVTNGELAYNGYKNLPYQYDGGKYNINGDSGINLMNALDLVVFSGALKDLSSAETVGINARKALLINLQNAYTGTTIENIGAIARILDTDTSNTGSTELLMSNIVSNNLGGSIIAGSNTDSNTGGGNESTGTLASDIDQTSCESANWIWVNGTLDNQGDGFCISPRIEGGTEFISWGDIGTAFSWNRNNGSPLTAANSYADNQYGVTYDLGSYTCKSTGTATSGLTLSDGDNTNLTNNLDSILSTDDTVENRMRYLAKYKTNSTKIDDINIDWITVPSIPAGFSVPALYLSDCIDGTRDLDTGKIYDTITYADYSTPTNDDASRIKMNRYLLGWTKVTGSHLPSAYSDISSEITDKLTSNQGEYQVACDAGLFGEVTWSTDQYIGANDDVDNESIWTSAIGYTPGTHWGQGARTVGTNGCGDQHGSSSGHHHGNLSARFVIRP